MVSMASSWPMMLFLRRSRIFIILLPSDSATLLTGIPVILETTVAMSSAVTVPLPSGWRSLIMEPASSIASIALSGRDLSEMYLSVSLTHASMASSVYSQFSLSDMNLSLSAISSPFIGVNLKIAHLD